MNPLREFPAAYWLDKRVAKLLGSNLYWRLLNAVLPVFDERMKRNPHSRTRPLPNGSVVIKEGEQALYLPSPNRLKHYLRDGSIWGFRKYMLEKYLWFESVELKNEVVIDVGSNVGDFSIAAAVAGATVISIEPDPRTYWCLTMNAAQQPKIQVHNIAVGNTEGLFDFFIATDEADSSLLKPMAAEQTEKVQVNVLTLDHFISLSLPNKPEIGFIKIEGEGFEPEILEGASKTLLRTKRVSVDCSPERYGASPAPIVSEILRRTGFRVWEAKGNVIQGENPALLRPPPDSESCHG